jgi:DNA polymerase-4
VCRALVIVSPDFARYKSASNAVSSLFLEMRPLVEPLSLDEAYLDVTENAWGEVYGTVVARRLRERIRTDTGLTASAGVAPNKFLAKIASSRFWRITASKKWRRLHGPGKTCVRLTSTCCNASRCV